MLQETINHYRERSGCTSVVFLDSQTVLHTGLLFKLSEIGISPKVWMILEKFYNNAKSCVLVNSFYSRTFRQVRGLCQGSMLAPKLYVIYMNELLNTLTRMKKKGSSILDVHVVCPTQADDIALISHSARKCNICF